MATCSQHESCQALYAFSDVRSHLQRHVFGHTETALAAGDYARGAIASASTIDQRRVRIRAAFLEGIGGLPACDTPLNPRLAGCLSENGFLIEKVVYSPRPGVHVAAIDTRLAAVDAVAIPSSASWASARHYYDHGIRGLVLPGRLRLGVIEDRAGS